MSSRQFYRRSTCETTVAVKPVKAKCSANQRLIDILLEKRAKVGDHNNYAHTLRKATDSLAKHPDPITSFQGAKALKGIGDHVANLLFPPQKAVPPSPASSVGSTSSKPSKRKRPPPPGNTLGTIQEKPSSYQKAYDDAVQESTLYKSKTLLWKVVLVVDLREKKSNHMIAKCQMSGIPCEERPLPIGDMAWIAQGLDPDRKKVLTELMLGTIIERKTTEDLKSSLFGTRYNEQQLRLKHSGIPQVLFLIEGDITKDLRHCPAETIHTTLHAIRLHKHFSIVQTAHMDETVQTLKRMHRRILQRSFPESFLVEALPEFGESRRRQNRKSLDGAARNRGERRRLSSLMEMTFDTDPVLLPNMERFVSYNELKAKIELDRQVGTRTVGSIHAAMLKQVASFSDRKVEALCRNYSTANQLFSAYYNETDKPNLVKEIPITEPDAVPLRKIGPKSSQELYTAYATGGSGRIVPRVASVSIGTKPSPSVSLASSSSEATKKLAPSVLKQAPSSTSSVVGKVPGSVTAGSFLDSAAVPKSSSGCTPTNLFIKTGQKVKRTQPVSECIIDLLTSEDEDEKKPKAKRKASPMPENQMRQRSFAAPCKKNNVNSVFFDSSSDDSSLEALSLTKKNSKTTVRSPEVYVIE